MTGSQGAEGKAAGCIQCMEVTVPTPRGVSQASTPSLPAVFLELQGKRRLHQLGSSRLRSLELCAAWTGRAPTS